MVYQLGYVKKHIIQKKDSHMRRILLTSVLLFTAIAPAAAQDLKTVLDIPEGATLISLAATERVEVEQDLLIANLSYEAENKDPAKLQEEINKIMTRALAEARAVKTVKVSTLGYQVYPYDYNPDPKPLQLGEQPKLDRKWRGSQTLMLKGKASDDLLGLVGKLQALRLNIGNLSYTVSPELMEETQNIMLESALRKLKTKAERTAKALGKSQSDLLNVNVDTGGYAPQPYYPGAVMMKAASAEVAMTAPVAAPGQSDITLTVNAQALIK